MRSEIMAILVAGRRKLAFTRAAESAAVGATAAGLCAAAVEVAWIAGRSEWICGAVLCVLPAVVGAVVLASRTLRDACRLDRSTTVLVLAICIASAAVGETSLVFHWHLGLSQAVLPLVFLPVGAVFGAAWALLVGVSLREAAIFLDSAARMQERLATAAELAQSPGADGPVAKAVYAQAVTAARKNAIGRVGMFERTAATAGALGLVVLLCAALALVPGGRPPSRLAETLVGMSAGGRQKVAERLRKELQRAETAEGVRKSLAAAAAAVEDRDAEFLSLALEALEKAGVDLSSLLPQDFLAGPAGVGGSDGEAAGLGSDSDISGRRQGGKQAELPAGPTSDDVSPRRVQTLLRVYDPRFDKARLSKGRDEFSLGGPGGQGVFVRRGDAWSAAKDRAADSAARGRVPHQYSQLIRDYFLDEQ